MDTACCALVALVIGAGCGADAVRSSAGDEPGAETPPSGGRTRGSGVPGGGTEAMGDAGAADAAPIADGGDAGGDTDGDQGSADAAGAAIDSGEPTPVIDGGMAGASAGSGGSAGGSGEAGAGGMPEHECSASEPCLLDSIEIATATKSVDADADDLGGAFATLGASGALYPLYLDTVSLTRTSGTFVPDSFVFETDAGNEAADEAAAYVESHGGWIGRAALCVSVPVGISGQCWVIQQARIEIPAGSTITSFIAVIAPLELVQDGNDSTLATVGGRWEVWGY
jgi:hypothetical protein